MNSSQPPADGTKPGGMPGLEPYTNSVMSTSADASSSSPVSSFISCLHTRQHGTRRVRPNKKCWCWCSSFAGGAQEQQTHLGSDAGKLARAIQHASRDLRPPALPNGHTRLQCQQGVPVRKRGKVPFIVSTKLVTGSGQCARCLTICPRT